MNRPATLRGTLAALALLGAVGCTGDLDVANPNAPDAERAFSDPATIASLAGGSLRQWMVTRQDQDAAFTHSTMSDAHTASWNNWNSRYYSSYASDCPTRCGWVNNAASAQGVQIEAEWYGFYSALSSVNDALIAIRQNGVIITDQTTTKMVETVSVLMQGMVLGELSLTYDQGFIVTEETDLSNPLALPLATRAELRDAAVERLEEAYALAKANTFSTPSSWFGEVNGRNYSNTQIAQLARTLQAQYIALHARNATENTATNWAQVATFASQGMSTGTPYDLTFWTDFGAFYDGMKVWGNDQTLSRIDTRFAAVVTAGPDPAKVHKTPWPVPGGNPAPDAYDKRVGDGSWGPDDDLLGIGTPAATDKAGDDFAWAGATIFPSARGTYHFSNLGYHRYSYLTYPGYGLPNEAGQGQAPQVTAVHNDLLWAEALIRSGGSKAQAAQLINKTRVGRGGLTPLTGGEDNATMLRAVAYEQMIEDLDMGSISYFHRRRVTPPGYLNSQPCPTEAVYCLWEDTPRQKPIPAKELTLLQKEIYSFGGQGKPSQSAGMEGGSGVRSVREIWADMENAKRALRGKRAYR